MGEHTAIEWTDRTWNPWQGLYREKKRYGQDPATVVRSKPPTFGLPLSKKWANPANVFVCSWSDFFIAEADAWRPEAWDIIRRARHLTFQIPTKRPERIAACLPPDWGDGWPNVWLGASTENQAAANARIPALLSIPARVRFISAEPLLGPINLHRIERDGYLQNALRAGQPRSADGSLTRYAPPALPGLDWVIAGGESGPFARPMHPEWLRLIAQQCAEAGVPFFFKQWGEWRPAAQPFAVYRRREDGGRVVEFPSTRSPEPLTVAIPAGANDNAGPAFLLERVGKHAAGAELDGRTWKQFPAPRP